MNCKYTATATLAEEKEITFLLSSVWLKIPSILGNAMRQSQENCTATAGTPMTFTSIEHITQRCKICQVPLPTVPQLICAALKDLHHVRYHFQSITQLERKSWIRMYWIRISLPSQKKSRMPYQSSELSEERLQSHKKLETPKTTLKLNKPPQGHRF